MPGWIACHSQHAPKLSVDVKRYGQPNKTSSARSRPFAGVRHCHGGQIGAGCDGWEELTIAVRHGTAVTLTGDHADHSAPGFKQMVCPDKRSLLEAFKVTREAYGRAVRELHAKIGTTS